MLTDTIRIILADDDEDDRNFFVEAFEEIKIKTIVTTVRNGSELLQQLNDCRNVLPHIIFLDLNMPIINGMDCLKLIRENETFKNVAIAIYSTSSSEEDIENTFVLGANIYIKKPNDFHILKKILSNVVSMNLQFETNGLNKENFLLRI